MWFYWGFYLDRSCLVWFLWVHSMVVQSCKFLTPYKITYLRTLQHYNNTLIDDDTTGAILPESPKNPKCVLLKSSNTIFQTLKI